MSTGRILIIGGGPAGAAAAIAIAKSGVGAEVVLVEAKPFPRAKVCGEFLSPLALSVLERLIRLEDLGAIGAQAVDQFVLAHDAREFAWKLPTGSLAISRRALDAHLLGCAVDCGTRVIQPARVDRVEYGDNSVAAFVADSSPIEADIVIHADGAGRHDPVGPTHTRPGVVGMKCHFRPRRPIRGVQIRSINGGYVGTIQIENGLATCAMVVSNERISRFKGNTDAMLAEAWPEFAAEEREGPWLACGVADSAFITPGHPRSFRIGNAAAAVEPVGGEGIGLALWSGEALGNLLGQHGLSLSGLRTAQTRLARAYRRMLFFRRPSCRLAAAALSRPAIVHAARPLLAVPRLTIEPWYRLTGKPTRRLAH